MSDQAPRRPRSAGDRDRTVGRDAVVADAVGADAVGGDAPLEIIGEGGEAACWAHLVCPDCGAMVSEGHARGCPAARADQQG
jgi:hypothetical protein